ncbi:MAG TPA: glutamate-5-semialdehyde dehydrogenase [Firmicutes bacterium]|nr:glutamate-5-semialdehyde dehydrogenase [Bacillota bacterium]
MRGREEIYQKALAAREAAWVLATLPRTVKDRALNDMASALIDNSEAILEANGKDVDQAKASGASKAFLDRLLLTPKRIEDMAKGLRDVASLPDPVGEVVATWTRPNGLRLEKVRVPFGVIAIIYEARPNVTADAAGLALKSGNAVILRGSSTTLASNKAIVSTLVSALGPSGVPAGSVQLIESPGHEVVGDLLKRRDLIDVVIPRGGAGLINMVVENSRIPVIETGVGNCHVFVDSSADIEMARDIVINAKCQRPAVCNAMETLLVHEAIAPALLPDLGEKLRERGVELRACPRAKEYLPYAKDATESDWETEFLDLILAVKVVKDVGEAISHIRRYGTKHSEAIVTRDEKNARRFMDEVDAAAVYVNASTRFTDGGEFGFGAEMGISTQKLHARGPIGLPELTTIKYKVYGQGHVRA